jgi:3-oxoacyl-[acyl-carrier protein] reductase
MVAWRLTLGHKLAKNFFLRLFVFYCFLKKGNRAMFNLSGQKAVVTGASGGIGHAIVKALVAQGCQVVVTGRNEGALKALEQEFMGQVMAVVGDLSSAESADAIVAMAEEKMGQVDILVNNAGLTRDTLSVRMADDAWQQVIDVNLTATFRLTRAVLKGMMKRRHGRVINMSSVVAVTGNPGQANYCASKAGMIGMTKALAAEVASRGITLNCVAPGFIETAMTDALTPDQKSKITTNIPAQKMGTPADIAASVVYLASAEAAYITGQTLHVNGGMTMV